MSEFVGRFRVHDASMRLDAAPVNRGLPEHPQGTSGIRSSDPHAENPRAPRCPADLVLIHEAHFAALRRS
jgi:hypothetical protein